MVDRNTLAKISGKYGNDIVRGEGRDRRPRPKNDPTQSKEGKEHTCVLLSARDELEYFFKGGILHMHRPRGIPKNTTYSVYVAERRVAGKYQMQAPAAREKAIMLTC